MNNYAVARYSLLLQIILPRAARLTPWKWTLMILFAGVDSGMTGKVTTGGKGTIASRTNMFLFLNWILDYRNNLLFHKSQTSVLKLVRGLWVVAVRQHVILCG
jgi:hypothetical protein